VVLDGGIRTDALPESAEGASAARYASLVSDLIARLEAESAIAGVSLTQTAPGGEPTAWIDVEGASIPEGATGESGWVATGTRAGHEVRFNRVDLRFLDLFDVPVLAGRAFAASDLGAAANTVLVNQTFVQNVLGGGDPLGRRVRYVGMSNDAEADTQTLGAWHEIVGVVSDFPATPMQSGLSDAKIYHATPSTQLLGGTLSIHVRGGEPLTLSGRLREIAASVDPNLQLRAISNLDAMLRHEQGILRIVATVLAGVTGSVLLLAAAGIYALVSFTVTQRRKEIGIRAALGADPRHIVQTILGRAVWQLSIGAAAGAGLAALLDVAAEGELMARQGAVMLPIVGCLMMAIGVLAALGPARRGLRVHPTEALREE
jgi:hypothetical protein